MFLRNKISGEIERADEVIPGFNSIKQFIEYWEDYEGPDTYYYISDYLDIESRTNDHDCSLPEEIWNKAIKRRKEVGNYFDSKEEAEKAVEKLKVLKTLRDKGFKFNGWEESVHEDSNIIYCTIPNDSNIKASEMDLLFGSEE